MPKRRKVSNILGLAVLVTVSARPMHPYEIASLLRARGKDQDMKIKWGTLYTVVRNLEKHGFLEVAQNVRHGARPERTVYRITDLGREEMTDWVRELVAVPEREFPRFEAALSSLGVLPPDEAAELLRQRLKALDTQISEHRTELAAAKGLPRIFLVEAEYDLALRVAEADWVRALLEDLTQGTLAGLDAWRGYHETGHVPEEIADWAEKGAIEH